MTNHHSSFEITTPNEYFNMIVLPLYEQFLGNNSSSMHALVATIMSYHLYEWNYKDNFRYNEFILQHPNKTNVANCLEISRKITNGTKHFSNKIITKVQSGFSAEFSDEFQRPLVIVTENSEELSADMLLSTIFDYWNEIINDT